MKKLLAISLALASTVALADTHSEKQDAMKKQAPPKAVEQPKPPPEVAAMMKAQAGFWRCTGKGAMDPAKPTEMSAFKGTYRAALDLDKFWIKGQWTGSSGKLKMKAVMYMTYDPIGKQWHRIMMDNWGMSGSESSTGLPTGATEGKITWEGESRMAGQTIKGRTTEEVAARSMKMTVEMSPDGRKWATGMEMTCTK